MIHPGQKVENYAETSRWAWEDAVSHGASLDRALMNTLQGAGPDGLTCEEIERITGRKHQASSANLSRLAARGLVVHTGKYGKTSANRQAKKWTLA